MIQLEFEKIYLRYFNYVYLYLLKLCKNEQLAEELTSETFFKAMNAIDKFQGKCNINTWLVTIAKNSYYNYIKRNKLLVEMDERFEIRDENVDIESQMIKSETSLEIYKKLHILEEPYKEVFQLRVFGELSFSQIGIIFEKTENWARVTYHRARLKIKERMDHHES